jgi:oligoendopeptidase F
MPTIPTDFVPARIDATDWTQIEPLLRKLLDRPVNSARDLEKWLLDRSELMAACAEAESDLYIDMTCDTESKAAQEAYTRYIENIPPQLKPVAFALDKRQVELSKKFPLTGTGAAAGRYDVLARDTAAEVEIFRDENVPIQTDLEKLSQQYQQVIGAMMVTYDGQEKTLPMMSAYQESTDRSVREKAWRLVAARRLKDAAAIDDLYDAMIGLRHRMSRNAGFDSFTGYAFKSKKRFDYTPADCVTFHNACAKAVVPFLRRQDEKRKRQLSVDALRPWDLSVDPKGRAPLKPFSGGEELIRKSMDTFARLDPSLATMLGTMGDGSNTRGAADGACLDLDSRKGKAPGGYQAMRDRQRVPFIFMNAAGLHRDVETMVHEAGHAFHSMLCIDEPLLNYRTAPLEFAEVASMSMELLTMPHWGGRAGFYPDDIEAARARRQQVEGSVVLLPWIATIDAFQHWVYANPTHSRQERTAHWLSLDDRFGHAVSWQGLEAERASVWHRQSHLFLSPFYYIEYGIAQLGALQLWLRSLEEGEKVAIDAYKRALSLGGSRPLPELFKAAGLKFDFGESMVTRLVDRVEKELDKLPE